VIFAHMKKRGESNDEKQGEANAKMSVQQKNNSGAETADVNLLPLHAIVC